MGPGCAGVRGDGELVVIILAYGAVVGAALTVGAVGLAGYFVVLLARDARRRYLARKALPQARTVK